MKRYDTTSVSQRFDGKRVYKTTYYPIIQPQDDDAIVITNEADTLDNLAFRFYSDPTLWWIIALANNLGKGRFSVPAGIQLRIPANVNLILNNFYNLNNQ
jgi:hypothetical protein